MPRRRAVLSLVAGVTAVVSGCGESPETTDEGFGLTTTGAQGAPGEGVGVDLTARGVGLVTYRVDALPATWQVTQGEFDPQPTSVRESYPPAYRWEPAVSSVVGTLIVAIPDGASQGDYSLPVEARAGDTDETAVSTAIITVEGPTTPPARTESAR